MTVDDFLEVRVTHVGGDRLDGCRESVRIGRPRYCCNLVAAINQDVTQRPTDEIRAARDQNVYTGSIYCGILIVRFVEQRRGPVRRTEERRPNGLFEPGIRTGDRCVDPNGLERSQTELLAGIREP